MGLGERIQSKKEVYLNLTWLKISDLLKPQIGSLFSRVKV